MRFSLTPIFVPLTIINALMWGFYWLLTHRYDRGWAWSFIIAASLTGTVAIALHIWTVDNRFRDLEAKLERLTRERSDDRSNA